jgi:hypothetical protein
MRRIRAAAALALALAASGVSVAAARQLPRPPAPPQILSASVSPAVVRSGSLVSAVVATTPGVVAVTAFAGGQAIGVPRVGIGRFAGSTRVPPLPPFVHGTFPVTFRARDARGAMTQTALSVTVP